MMRKLVNEMKLNFLGVSANESFARSAVSSFAIQLDPTIEELSDIKTAVSEAVTNCIVHAYPDGIGWVTLSARLYDDKSIVIAVKDKGIGIEDVARAMEPQFTTAPGDERSGIGFSVMGAFMDNVKVRSKPGKGTIVTLGKKLSPRAMR